MIRFIERDRDQTVKALVKDIAEAEWTIIVAKLGKDTVVGYINVRDELQIIGALHHAAHKISLKLEGNEGDDL